MLVLDYSLLTPPALEPVTLADVKAFCRVDADDTTQDGLLALMIAAARRRAEQITGRSLITQTWVATADRFPGVWWPNLTANQPPFPTNFEPVDFVLAHGPVTSITSVQYLDANGVLQTLSPSAYVLTGKRRLAPAYGYAWPPTLYQNGAVTITFQAGFGSDEDGVPEEIRSWLLVRVNTEFEQRSETEVVTRGTLLPNDYVDGLLDGEKEWAL